MSPMTRDEANRVFAGIFRGDPNTQEVSTKQQTLEMAVMALSAIEELALSDGDLTKMPGLNLSDSASIKAARETLKRAAAAFK